MTSSVTSSASTSAGSGPLGVDGLVSGIDSTSLINSLMKVEQAPQDSLRDQLATIQKRNSSYQTLNTLVASVQAKAKALAAPDGVSKFQATPSSAAVSATASSTASVGSIAFTVDRLAGNQVSVSAASATWGSSATPTLTFVDASGKATAITPASNSMTDVATALNAAKLGVQAIAVPVTMSDGTAGFRLQVSGSTGAAGAFRLYDGDPATVDTTSPDVFSRAGAATVSQAQDAQVTLWAGSAAAQTKTSASNTFTDVVPGLTVTASALSASPVTVTVAQDASAISKSASDLISGIASAIAYVTSNSAVSTTTDSSGVTTVTGGTLTGDSTARDARDRLSDAVMSALGNVSPTSLGISVDQSGVISFDAAAFSSALTADPSGTLANLQKIAASVQGTATSLSDPYAGTITAAVTGTQSSMTDLNGRIDDWTDRLAAKRAALTLQYQNLETTLSTLKQQQSYLTGALSSLITPGSSN